MNRFCEVIGKRVGEFSTGDTVPIACENCIVLLGKATTRQNLDISRQIYTKLGAEQTFTELSTDKAHLGVADIGSSKKTDESVDNSTSAGLSAKKRKRATQDAKL